MNEFETRDPNSTRAVVDAVFAAFRSHDLDRFRSLLADDAVLIEPSSNTVHRGPDAIVDVVGVVLNAIPDLRPDVQTVLVDGTRAAVEVVRTGTHTGALTLAEGTIPPTGREVRLPESIFFEVKEGHVTRMTPYVDRMHVLEELGVESA